jgi:GTP-binding protein
MVKKLPDDKDKELFYELQDLGKSLALVVNKIDNDKEKDNNLWAFYEFGIDDENLFGISVSHNRGTRSLIEWVEKSLPDEEVKVLIEEEVVENAELLDNDSDEFVFEDEEAEEEVEDNHLRVAIIGRVNVGKSSILNALLGEERSVVSPIAGTTIDPVDESFEYQDKTITFVDTAGLRRRGSIEGIEKYALMRTEEMLEKANLAIVVLDASRELTDLDEKIAGLVDKFGLGTVIVLNKWDENAETFEKLEKEIRRRFRFLYYAPIIAVSAKTGRSIDRLKDKLIEIYDNYSQRVSTSVLNRIIEEAVRRHALPSPAGNYLRIYYSTQFEVKPPRVALIMNKPKLLHFSYKRYLINFLRSNLNLEGTPVHIVSRGKGQRDEEFDLIED